jgi:SagB-type dehydrogenase family enzyme
MFKLFAVLLPALLGALLLAGWALKRGRPSRRAVNAVLSLVLLVYVGATAGLGLFWVARQQLPVFDWHYLFGYATLVLLVLHLAFNLPTLWRWLRGPAAARVAATHPPPAGRRTLLAALAAGLGGLGLGFLLGQRRPAPVAAAPVPLDARDFVVRWHHATSHRRGQPDLGSVAAFGAPPPPFLPAGAGPRVALPPPGEPAAGELALIGQVLWHGAGITARAGPLALRAAPSSGALFPIELHVVARRIDGLTPGAWRYDARWHALERMSDDIGASVLAADVPAFLAATAVFARSGHKYGQRCLRYVLADLGHLVENMVQAAAAGGLALDWTDAFRRRSAAQALAVDDQREGVLLLAPWDAGGRQPLPAPSAAAPVWRDDLTAALYAASAGPLRAGPATNLQRLAAVAPEPGSALALADAALPAQDPRPLIAARRSVRRFGRRALTAAELAAWLRALAPAPSLPASLRLSAVVARADGLAPGAYRVAADGSALWLQRAAVAGREAGAAALDQSVIAAAAVVAVWSLPRGALDADPDGPVLAYTRALVEAGRSAERGYLAAGALGLGVCSVGAFYDDEAAALVGAAEGEWVLHFQALGAPA